MPLSASDVQNIKLGVCSVKFGGEDLGLTKGGVEVEVATTTHKVTVDQFGNLEVKEYVTGRKVTVKVPLAETTLDRLKEIVPGSTLVTDGVDPLKKKLEVKHGTGTELRALAKALLLHPTANAAADKSEDFEVPLAMTPGAFNFAYKLDEERIYSVEFTGYPDSTTGLLFVVGDKTAAA